MNLVYGRDDVFVPWICASLNIRNPGPCVSIGIAHHGKIAGAALYNGMQLDHKGKPHLIEMSFATLDKRWANRVIIHGLLSYPFFQLRVKRVQVTVSKRNRTVRAFLKHLGFKYEGTGRLAWLGGGDACVYSLLSNEFFNSKWNLENKRGKIVAKCACITRSDTNRASSNSEQRANCAL